MSDNTNIVEQRALIQARKLSVEWDELSLNAIIRDEQLVYPVQSRLADQLVEHLSGDGLIATLCAPPQFGKTGTLLQAAFRLCTLPERSKMIKYDRVYVLSGMSDNAWREQTKDRLLPCWKDHVYHRGNLKQFKKSIEDLLEKKDILIIIDEVHIANGDDMLFSKCLNELNILNIDFMKTNNIKIIQTSATPSNALIDAEDWGGYHLKIVPEYNTDTLTYVSFETLKSEGRLRNTFELHDQEQCNSFFTVASSEFPEPCYHFVRAVSKGRNCPYTLIKNNIQSECQRRGWNLKELNAKSSEEERNDIFDSLKSRPEVHTVILIKDMLGAAKTIPDTYIGCVHESTPKTKDNSAEAQGLAGRMCGWGKRRGAGAPLIFCNVVIIERYIALFEGNFNYFARDMEWSDSRLTITNRSGVVSSKSFAHPSFVEGLEEAPRDRWAHERGQIKEVGNPLGFTTQEELIQEMNAQRQVDGHGTAIITGEALHQVEGYWISSTVNGKTPTHPNERMFKYVYDNTSLRRCIAENSRSHIVMPVYENEQTAPDGVRWFGRYLKRGDQ
jgi:hypothetical protein